jgi:glycosyltransferase involved in cell wall biosynthesis
LVQIGSELEESHVETLRRQGYEVVVVRETRGSRVLRTALALPGSQPLQVACARSKRLLAEALRLCEQQHFDVVHVEHLRGIASVAELANSQPLVWDAVDCISSLYAQAAVAGPNLFTRLLCMLEYGRTRRYEASIQRRPLHIVTISEAERQALQHLSGHDTPIDIVPSGVDLDYFQPTGQKRRRYNIVFAGKMSYHANVAAGLYLHRAIMPLIWQRCPQATLTIAGSDPAPTLQRLAVDPRVEVTGYVDDIRSYIGRAHVMLSPLLYGVGLQNKVLEAMALGTPSVVSKRSAAALSACDGQDILVAEHAQEFATHALRLFQEPQLHASLESNGRRYVEQQHRWEVMTARLLNIYERAIETYAYRFSCSLSRDGV